MFFSSSKAVSPSRKYVAICIPFGAGGHYFRRFILPEEYENNAEIAAWYFLNRIDSFSCIEGVIPAEDMQDLKDV